MFNLQGSELVIILLLALVVLGPEKLPDAMRKLGQFYAELKKMSSSFQQEFKAAVDEPMREVRDTANMLRDSADFRKLAQGERQEKPKSAEMAPSAPVTDVPFSSNGDARAGDHDIPIEPPLIPSPAPPAGPVVTGTPPVAPPPSVAPPPPPPPGSPQAPPHGTLLPPLTGEVHTDESSEVTSE